MIKKITGAGAAGGFTPHQQLEELKAYIREKGSMAVAFSGGVDSTFLLKVAHDVLGDDCVAVTGRSCTFPEREAREAAGFCRREGIRQIVVESGEMEDEDFVHNPLNRCYICKHTLFTRIKETAASEGFRYVAEASNMDDNGDYRPGLQAVAELEVLSPLRHCGLYKQTIRGLSKELGLPTWDKPAMACLSSRFVYGEDITPEKLAMVDQAEQFLMDAGFQTCRVRIHGNDHFLARVEVPATRISELFQGGFNEEMEKKFREIGFSYVTMDARGFRTGSMNEIISAAKKAAEMAGQAEEITE